MRKTGRQTCLLQLAITSSFLAFLIIVNVKSLATQLRITSETVTSTVSGVTWVEYYPEWFFQILAFLTVVTLVGLTITAARLFGKPYPTLSHIASRKTSLVSIFFLNVLFLGTSHVLSYPPFPFYRLYNVAMAGLCTFFGMDLQEFYDFSSFLLVLLLIVSVSARYRHTGAKTEALAVAQILSLTILPLELEIFAFDRSEWSLHFAQFQASYNIVPWFTNADLFFAASSVFALTLVIPWAEQWTRH